MSRVNGDVPTSGGVPMTDEVIAAMAEEAEDGYDVEYHRGRLAVRRLLGSAATSMTTDEIMSLLRDEQGC